MTRGRGLTRAVEGEEEEGGREERKMGKGPGRRLGRRGGQNGYGEVVSPAAPPLQFMKAITVRR